MKEYFSIRRLFPKTSVGLIFFIELFFAFCGIQGMTLVMQTFQQFCTGFKLELGAILIGAFVLLLISTFGFQLACILTSALGTIARNIFYLKIKNIKKNKSILIDLVAPISHIVQQTYKNNSKFYMRHYLLKSASSEKLEQMDEITEFFNKVDDHVKSIQDWDIICTLNYQESLSQDQRKLENMEEELAIDSSLHTVLFLLFPIIVIRIWTFGWHLAIGIGTLLLILLFAALPAFVSRKRRLARFMLTSYLDVYTVAELTEYTEREGEPKL